MQYTPEIWKEIPGYNKRYLVSNLGHVSVKMPNGEYKGRKLNYKTGYVSFSVSNGSGKQQSTFYVHRIVSQLFLGPKPIGMVIRHLDGNRFNNCVDNLKYGFPEENFADSKRHGSHKGIRNGNSKLDERDVKAIKSLLKDSVALSTIARAFNVTPSAINLIHKNKNWAHL